MTADEITKAVAERLGIDLYDDAAVTDFQGRVNAGHPIQSRMQWDGRSIHRSDYGWSQRSTDYGV